jgi:hypothetical protein
MLVDDGRTLEGTIFTAELGSGGRPENALQHLNEPGEDFLPVLCGGYSVLVNKTGILWVQLSDSAAEEIAEDAGSGRRVPVRLTLSGGIGILGTVVIVMPLERSRVVDYLNAAGRFFPVFGEDGVKLIQRRFVVTLSSGEGTAQV